MAEVTPENAPRKAREHFEKGMASFERGNLDYAMDMYMLALEVSPGFLKARKFLRAAAVTKAKQSKSNAFSRAMGTLGGSGTLLKVQSLLKNKPERALQEAEDLLRKDPLNPTFVHTACQAAEAAGFPEVAIMNLEVAREHGAKDAKSIERLAKLYTEVNRMHDARLAYEELVRLKPNDPQAVKKLKDATALDTMQRGGWNEAGSYRDVMKDAKQATLLEQQSKAVKTSRDVDALLQEAQAKVEREPQNVNYKRSLAELLAKSERYDEALAILTEAQQATGGADPQIARLISTIRLEQIDRAVEQFKAAGNTAAIEAKQKERADFLFQDAEDRVQRYPNDLQFKYEYGVLLFEQGRLNEAIQQFQRAQQNPQRRIRSLYYIALCFKQKQQYDIAAEQMEKAAAELQVLDDTKKDILYELGTMYEAMGKRDRAAALYKEIYSVDIGYRDVAAKIETSYHKSE
ncbi:MAG TPA: tetratricopeptide repeat protein [Kiritimatiellia bacterium]|nr:tetratricopeptide repeat protein [Kiritimatiellia bacterium]